MPSECITESLFPSGVLRRSPRRLSQIGLSIALCETTLRSLMISSRGAPSVRLQNSPSRNALHAVSPFTLTTAPQKM